MPIYEYRCDDNNTTLEASHPMSETLTTWGDLCERTGHTLGSTPPEAPIAKVISMPIAHTSDAPTGPSMGPGMGGCGPSCGCVGH